MASHYALVLINDRARLHMNSHTIHFSGAFNNVQAARSNITPPASAQGRVDVSERVKVKASCSAPQRVRFKVVPL